MAQPVSRTDIILLQPERFAGSDPEHFFDQVDAGHELRHRVFDLQAGVHLEEMEPPLQIDDEFDGAGRPVSDCLGQCLGLPLHALPKTGVEPRCRRLFKNLLVAALDGALALAKRNALSMRVGQDLHFDVPGIWEVAFDEDPGVAKT